MFKIFGKYLILTSSQSVSLRISSQQSFETISRYSVHLSNSSGCGNMSLKQYVSCVILAQLYLHRSQRNREQRQRNIQQNNK